MATISRLWTSLESCRQRTANGRRFVSPVDLRRILTLDAIKASVLELSIQKDDRLGLDRAIYEDGLVLYAVLIWMRRAESIVQFRSHGAFHLPLDPKFVEEIISEGNQTLINEVQWEFKPYVFRKDMCDYHAIIRDQEVLPFIHEQYVISGGFGDVSKVTIAASLQAFFPATDGDTVVIRKRLKPKTQSFPTMVGGQDYFKQEMTCLRLLHRLHHPNIVSLLGSYTYRGEHNFLFPCLDRDLGDLFKLHYLPAEFKYGHIIVQALYGLASALENIHVLSLRAEEHGVDFAAIGYHHDIRPENILVDKNIFLIADFGLSKLKDIKLESTTNWKAGVGDYIAPECMDEKFAHQRVGRAIDIWAFGCLMADVLTFFQSGKVGLERFQERRSSAERLPTWEDQYFFAPARVKDTVIQWLQDLTNDLTSTLGAEAAKGIKDLLFAILEMDPSKRPPASRVAQRLGDITILVHFWTVQEAFDDYFGALSENNSSSASFMRLWFERERFRALSSLAVATRDSKGLLPNISIQHGLQGKLCGLLGRLQTTLVGHIVPEFPIEEPESDMANTHFDSSVNEAVESIIEDIWNLLPTRYQRLAELIWQQKALQSDATSLIRPILPSKLTTQLQYDKLEALATMKALRLQYIHREGPGAADKSICDYNELKGKEELFGHHFGTYRGSRVLVEWEYYSKKWDKINPSEKAELMALKANGLGVTPKPPEFKILNWFRGDTVSHGYGFLYAFPGEANESFTTLFSLLDQDMRQKQTARQPSLIEKFRVAAAIVTTVLELHTVGWLHENINSNNVMLFEHDTNSSKLASSANYTPYLVDFRHSRPDSNIWYTQGPSSNDAFMDYRHPDYKRGARFHRIYDYYSLGVVLLELGTWNPLAYMTAKHRIGSPEHMRDVLVETYAPRLGPRMGVVYRDAVLSCLNQEFEKGDGDGDNGDEEVLSRFLTKVVEPLEELANLCV